MPAISVIMPVYNSDKFLRDAIDSVLQQTFTDFELILIDDGSKDGSGAICDDYADRDKRVRVVHQENAGICAARNAGLKKASGEFVAFIDNDDTYKPFLLEDCYRAIVDSGVDVVKYGYHVRETFSDGRPDNHRDTVAKETLKITPQTSAQYYRQVKASGFFYMIWNGLYRRSFLENIGLRFDESIKFGYEDWIFNFKLYQNVQSLMLLDTVYYVHEQRAGTSTSKKFRIERPYNCMVSAACEREMFDALGLDALYPGLWHERLAVYILEILQLFELDECTLTRKEKQNILQEAARRSPFNQPFNNQMLEELKHRSRKKALVMRWFVLGKYSHLLWLFKIYGILLRLKTK